MHLATGGLDHLLNGASSPTREKNRGHCAFSVSFHVFFCFSGKTEQIEQPPGLDMGAWACLKLNT